jgi:two-component system sensor histidine kinase SenX3
VNAALGAAAGVLIGLALALAAVMGRAGARRRHDRAAERAAREVEEARDAAAASARRLAAVLDGLPQALLLFRADDQLLPANAAAARYLQARHGDALVEAGARRLAAEAQAGGLPSASDGDRTATRRVDLAGPPRLTFELAAHRLGDGSGDVLVVVEDVTERRRLEEVRRDFVANISHELRTPLGALSVLAETVAEEEDAEVTARLARRLQAEAIRLGRTVDDLVLLSGIEGGDAQVEPVRLVDVVSEAVERRSGLAEARRSLVKVELDPPDLVLPADRRQLVSALANLLDNALTYSDPGSVVLVRSEPTEMGVELAVVDHGIGIPARDLGRIFERFYRVDRARSRRTGGTGLGLAVVRHVATNHGGEVVVRSREGEGSTFLLRLPLRASTEPAGGVCGGEPR